MKKLLLVMMLLAGQVGAKELPSWGMTEVQYKMPNFTTKMQKIGDQALKNDWLLKITAPKDWHSKIRTALSDQGTKNVQINFKDSLYKSITITATPGMAIKSTNSQNNQPAVAKKQVVIEKPEMDTQIEAPEFNNDFKANDILADIGEIELALPSNGQINNNSMEPKKKSSAVIGETEKNLSDNVTADENNNQQAIRENLRIRHARGKTVDKTISYANITDKDDLYVADDIVLVKRYVNRGVAIYYWMQEAYNPNQHRLIEKGSGKYVKSKQGSDQAIMHHTESDKKVQPSQNPGSQLFDFIAVTDNQAVQDQLRRDFIRNKAVNSTLSASQLKSKDILYISEQTVLVVRPLGNSLHTYFWLKGETNTQQSIKQMGPQKFVIQ